MLNNNVGFWTNIGIDVNEEKAKVIVMEKKVETDITIAINSKQLINDYRYLGSEKSDDGEYIKEVRIQIALAKMAFWKHNKL